MLKILSILFFGIMLQGSSLSYAANYDNPIEGKLKSVYSDFLTIEVYSNVSKAPEANPSSKGDLAIKIVPQTIFDNFSQISDLKQGDLIKVSYKEGGNKDGVNAKTATNIAKVSDADVATSTHSVTTTVTTTTSVDPNIKP